MNTVAYWILKILLYTFSIWPLKVHYFFSNIMAFILYRIVKYRLSTVHYNLARSFPDKKYNELDKLTKDYYKYLTDLAVETIWGVTHSKQISKRLVFDNLNLFTNTFDLNNHILVVIGHQGNWELFSQYKNLYKECGFPDDKTVFFFVYKKLKNKLMERLTQHIRTKLGTCDFIDHKQIFRHMLRNKDEKGAYFFVADQAPVNGARFNLDFLNQKSAMFDGPEYIAKKFNMPVLYLEIRRTSRGVYHNIFTKICDKAKDEKDGFITYKYAKLLEQSISRTPESYLWSHRRWKKPIEISEKSKFITKQDYE